MESTFEQSGRKMGPIQRILDRAVGSRTALTSAALLAVLGCEPNLDPKCVDDSDCKRTQICDGDPGRQYCVSGTRDFGNSSEGSSDGGMPVTDGSIDIDAAADAGNVDSSVSEAGLPGEDGGVPTVDGGQAVDGAADTGRVDFAIVEDAGVEDAEVVAPDAAIQARTCQLVVRVIRGPELSWFDEQRFRGVFGERGIHLVGEGEEGVLDGVPLLGGELGSRYLGWFSYAQDNIGGQTRITIQAEQPGDCDGVRVFQTIRNNFHTGAVPNGEAISPFHVELPEPDAQGVSVVTIGADPSHGGEEQAIHIFNGGN